jgi:hypothetical protein
MAMEQRRADMGAYGGPGDYEYGAGGARPSGEGADILPGFEPKGNSKMDFKVTIGETGLTYTVVVTDPLRPGQPVLTTDQTGAVEVNKKY